MHPDSDVAAAMTRGPATREAIAAAIRNDVLDGKLQPGDRLPEPMLAERFGVSRVPVREALSQLQSEGFVNLERYKGATVSGASRADAIELMQVRRGLEVFGARLAAERIGGEFASELRLVTESGTQAERLKHHDQVPPLVLRFHTLIAEASGNRELARTLEHTLRRIAWVFDRDVESRADGCWRDHTAIAGAVLDGSSFQAGYLMDEHVKKDEDLVRQLIR
ncbi:GntR family transcriptional regulator [Williamsia sp. DF01-3]|uniref:GntR family transcriptional regulator n=1 Tax=Williamsia sp. DF01-3 TaxID=2934157 RepID=UPI001FF61595|nr:GntR family transcriptional regulator [Williamsia sp. DF01-3]MCK0516804.1 GntR family transcriptional regulator [Williamsia sp. DF01-3]